MGYFVDAQVILLVRHREMASREIFFRKFLEIRSGKIFTVPERIISFRNVQLKWVNIY
jgi:hypothetical protein